MKTPRFWQNKNIISWALFLPGCLYALATWGRIKFHKPQQVRVPVICIGNLTAGGSGKTPVAISVAQMLKSCGKTPGFVSRGYGGKLKGVVVDITKHTPEQVGDEPLLLAREAIVAVEPDRYEAALIAIKNGADTIIMDDGFQNPTLYKDKSLLVVDGNFGLGNMMPLPAGPMREFFGQGIKRANGVVIIGEDKHGVAKLFGNLSIFKAKVVAQLPKLAKNKVFAFAGIGSPQKFYQSLEDCGVTIAKTKDFPDHHFYERTELLNLIDEAQKLGADIITTSKDMVKIPYDLQPQFKVLEIAIKWQDESAIKQFLLK